MINGFVVPPNLASPAYGVKTGKSFNPLNIEHDPGNLLPGCYQPGIVFVIQSLPGTIRPVVVLAG